MKNKKTCIIDRKVPRELDKQWHIDMAWKRINDFIGE